MSEQSTWAGVHPACPARTTALCVCEPYRRSSDPAQAHQAMQQMVSQGSELGYEMRAVRDGELVAWGFFVK